MIYEFFKKHQKLQHFVATYYVLFLVAGFVALVLSAEFGAADMFVENTLIGGAGLFVFGIFAHSLIESQRAEVAKLRQR
jgi:hypothetical protein